MAKKISSGNKIPVSTNSFSESKFSAPNRSGILVSIVFIICLTLAGSMDNILEKWMGLASAIIILLMLFLSKRSSVLKDNITPLFYSVMAYVLWGGISAFYAESGKFAIFEFSKLLVALCVYLAVLFFTKQEEIGFKRVAYLLASAGGFFGVISVDAASSGLLWKLFKSIASPFTISFNNSIVYEQGVRIAGLFGNANTYGGFMALAVILSLYLVTSSSDKKSSILATSLLAVNSLAYLLAFSMGSLFMFLIACLIMIGNSEKGTRISLFLLMAETAVLAFVFAFVSILGLGKTGVLSFVPILALILNGVLLYQADTRLRPSLNHKINGNFKLLIGTVLAVILLISGYLAAGFLISSPLPLQANETVNRGLYIQGGDYSLNVDSSVPVNLSIESQNNYDLMRHTSTVLYSGTNENPIAFTVPEDSKIVQVSFSSAESGTISNAKYTGAENGTIHLKYPLLPGFMANRIQNLFANENLVQRVIFFEDGLKLFSKSPVIGRGLGGFENGAYSVQDFVYTTKYTHNHYIQVLCDLGVVGFVLFVSMLVFSVLSIAKAKRKSRSLYAVPVLAACAFQMFGQALVDAIWSTGVFLGFSAAVLALITIFCAEPLPLKEAFNKNRLKIVETAALAVFTGAFVLLLSGNLYAQAQAKLGVEDFDDIKTLIALDRFESNDYKLSYIVNAPQSESEEVQKQAQIYVEQLSKVESNSLLPYIVDYQFKTYFDSDAVTSATEGISNIKSNPNAWIQLFDIFEQHIDPVGPNTDDAADRLRNPDYYVNSVLELYRLLLERNENSLDDVTLTPYNDAFIGKMLEIEATHLYSIDWVFTVIMTYAFDSDCAVDTNQDGMPDNLSVLSGTMQRQESGLRFDVSDNSVIQLDLYHKLHGKYTLNIETAEPQQGLTVTLNGTNQEVLYDGENSYVEIDLEDNSNRTLSTFVVTFPTAAEVKNISFTTKLEGLN